ncbi:hypothetical protein CYMTET_24748 [Cymbomonas tetramitiformis]|uniref:Thioredoxin domain-containing protein n=1 Tax=Cymbomonas tetramitiformis TaxID=36881 RepID=A0AAE0FVG6_9CHLO|nr:hypothetical protein CYMTET_24748 [Cymbomonas tetramitiformis]|eukprot:gene26375-32349_t
MGEHGEFVIPLEEADDGKTAWNKHMQSGKTVIVDFSASWCGPCKQIAPHLAHYASQATDCVFIVVDVDEFEDITESCGVSAMPTFQVWKDGAKLKEFSGGNADKLRELIQEYSTSQITPKA